jgi:SAM-dependent methyltransferase
MKRKKEWFDDDSFWVDMYPFMFPKKNFSDAEDQLRKVLKLAGTRGKDALDLCCGPGRFAVPLSKRGFRVTGVDTTRFLRNKARRRARSEKVRIEFVEEDMRSFSRPASFNLALSMFTSFGYFDNKDEDLQVLENVWKSLRKKGVFVLDVAGKEILARIFRPTASQQRSDGTVLIQRHEIVDDWTRIRNEWILLRKGRSKRYRFHLRLYSGQELRDRLYQAGFGKVGLYGDLDGSEYGTSAKRLIAVARKT